MFALADRVSETVERAVRTSPYYAEAFRGCDTRIASLADLRRLPLLTRKVLVERGHDMVATDHAPVTVSMTGGTSLATGGARRPLLIYRSEAESQARRAVIEGFLAGVSPRPLIVQLVNLGHGYEAISGFEGCFQMAIERPFHIDAILALLDGTFAFRGFTPRVQALSGALRHLKALTFACMERGIDGRRFGLGLVMSSSNHLTSRWRRLLEEYWGAAVDDGYGLSEVPGLHARRCVECGRFHFSTQAVAEVLALDGDAPVEHGVGRLVATALHPLCTMQPIIRYDTEDVIEIVGHCAARETFGFEFLGRRSQLVTAAGADGPRVLASPIAVNEVLDAVPDIAVQNFAFVKDLGIRASFGLQRWSLAAAADAPRRIELEVELRWSPHEYRAEAAGLADSLRPRVLAAAPALAASIDAGESELRIAMHAPGTTSLMAYV